MGSSEISAADSVWVFNGANNKFPSGIFSTKDSAILWIESKKLTGILTNYPLNLSVYDWAIQSGAFLIRKEHHKSAIFISNFSSASQDHYHYTDGVIE
jgi:hypothetical protein